MSGLQFVVGCQIPFNTILGMFVSDILYRLVRLWRCAPYELLFTVRCALDFAVALFYVAFLQ